jgi:phosphomannomutase
VVGSRDKREPIGGSRPDEAIQSADALRARARAWLAADPDPTTRAELEALLERDDLAALSELFAGALEFGTAGLRALLGPGPLRMNRAVVIRTTFGLMSHLAARIVDSRQRGVVVAHDARRMSREFAEDAAGVLAAGGFRVHLFAQYAITPLLAFAVEHLGAAAGVMVTASHNPADYNGIKVYGAGGAQIVSPDDGAIARAIEQAPDANSIAREPLPKAKSEQRVVEVGDDVEDAYLRGVMGLLVVPEARPSLAIVYTPLHGVAYPLAERALAAAGFGKIVPVREQLDPDPRFPTAPFPNPEEPGVLRLALELAETIGADLVLANDPDGDRLAVAVPQGNGRNFVQLTGNQVGVLLGHYLLREGPTDGERAVLSTIVSSPMLGAIARRLGVYYEETLTGFKWIAARGKALAREGKRFVFGYEEALGYAVGDLVHDKDGVSAALLFAELAAVCRARGTSVSAYLEQLYRDFGLYSSAQCNIALRAEQGGARALMGALRRAPPQRIGERAVLVRRDYESGEGAEGSARLPRSNVLAFELEGGTRVVVRPSGTEPKVKCYLDHREPLGPSEPLAIAEARASGEMNRVAEHLMKLISE